MSEKHKVEHKKTIGNPRTEPIGKWTKEKVSFQRQCFLGLSLPSCRAAAQLRPINLRSQPPSWTNILLPLLLLSLSFAKKRHGQIQIWRQLHWPHMLPTFNLCMSTFISIHKHLFQILTQYLDRSKYLFTHICGPERTWIYLFKCISRNSALFRCIS